MARVSIMPLEFRIALDAASVWLSNFKVTQIPGSNDLVAYELEQRFGLRDEHLQQGFLWFEPQINNWQEQLQGVSSDNHQISRLAVIISIPLAKMLPEISNNSSEGVGTSRREIKLFVEALSSLGFEVERIQTFHTGTSILINQFADLARRLGFFAFGDRLGFAAKKHYIRSWKALVLGTCLLITARKK